ncbi:hypothetical protein [Myxococcus llanfairpwllgwyngyllgogerychwyrndrobwllllantysiliogogogochensis]|uniref:hypothetical protein n=1 Tax=Myxococcus llanfairpwllgwyngyllgogerychwyrndrobwllllantysiliogogogochensis TaxID=2590453 RepID=UPI0015EFF62F|nr:hypothetical protein [Myxococcus llanfairpwllgwyngyllgogerychwyrndrobwllllantysiliogogogochensis]
MPRLLVFSSTQGMVLLPQQEFEALIVGLPAHVVYQSSLQSRLRDLRQKIDRAIRQEKHPKDIKADILADLNSLSEDLLEQVKSMSAGVQLTAASV